MENFVGQLLTEKNINRILTLRQSNFLVESVPNELTHKYVSAGWDVDKSFKNRTRLKKRKSVDHAFEDEVWATFAKLGFTYLNKDRKFKIPYALDFTLTQQIDVFAVDDEAIILVECKAADGEPKRGNFKEAIEAIGGKKDGILKVLKKLFPGSKHKVKFIFATKNYIISEPDKERLNNFGIVHFDEETIKYYRDLASNLGVSARFQLLGNLFAGQTIPELDNKIPAIEGKMGGHTYYSFSIEPEKLLKIGYVLHRNKANKKLMPTYQRLIKKNRLVAVQEFVDNGGFFPNSIIINIDAERPLTFDRANTQVESAISRLGILHLPKSYRSAFIIDGQHRLYGYANSEYKTKNSIPVVAFVNLDRRDQVRLFMQINENQKAVNKNLRLTLDADRLWESDNLQDRVKALKLSIAQDLGDELDSPLYDRIIIGENPKTPQRCITLDAIKTGLDRSNFFGAVSKTAIKQDGTFYNGNNDETSEILLRYIKGCLTHVKEGLPVEWSKGEAEDGFLTINAGIESLIRLLSDIVDHLAKNKGINPKSAKLQTLLEETQYYLDPLIEFLRQLKPDEKANLKKSYGSGQKARYWRTLQKVINNARSDFKPDGLAKYWKDEAKQYNEDAFKMIRDIETYLKADFRSRLERFYGHSWFKKGVPGQVQDDAVLLQSQKNRKVDKKEDEVDIWDCLNIIDYRKIATYGSNWRDVFEKHYTKPGEEKINGGKDEKTKWMHKLEEIRNQNFHTYSVKEEEYNFLCSIHEWLIEGNIDNEYEA